MKEPVNHRWLLLIHQIPDKPGYLRVKVWRRLQRMGAVAVKNSVYVLPRSDQAHEDLQWVLREIAEAKGEASICEARFIDGMSEDQIEGLFRVAREQDYAALGEQAQQVANQYKGRKALDDERRTALLGEVKRLKRRLAEIVEIDFFGATGREAAEAIVAGLERRLVTVAADLDTKPDHARREGFQKRTWVTRKGIHVDRIASAWLIRRFIDAEATFKFVPGKAYQPLRGELRFDMFEAEFTHEGDRCTFEVLVKRFGMDDAALAQIAEIIHDIDLKDAKFDRPDTAGIDRLILGIAMGTGVDEERLAQGSVVFDSLYSFFTRKPARS